MDHSRLVVRSSMGATSARRFGLARIAAFAVLLSSDAHASEVARFVVDNGSPYVVRAVHASPPRNGTWGPNLIDGRLLKPGSTAVLELAGGCGVYDLRFVAPDGIEFLEDEVPFCGDDTEQAAAAAASGAPADREDVVRLGADVLTKTTRARAASGDRNAPAADAGEGGR